PPRQRRLRRRLSPHYRRGDRHARQAGHPGEQRRYHDRQDRGRDDRRRLVQRPRGESFGRVLLVPGSIGAHGFARNWAASKSGLFGLTKTLAKEAAYMLAKSGKRSDDSIGITVNTVTPGLITTDMTT